MSRHPACVVLAAAIILTGANQELVQGRQSTGSVPTFEVERSWPKMPDKWKLGDASSVAVDARDHLWLLHRPRTLPNKQAPMAAPPVLEFDAAGNFIATVIRRIFTNPPTWSSIARPTRCSWPTGMANIA